MTLNPVVTVNGHHIAGKLQNNNQGGAAYITNYTVDTTAANIPISSTDFPSIPVKEDTSTGATTDDTTSRSGTHTITINRSSLKVGVNKITFNASFYVPIKCGQYFTDTTTTQVDTSLTVTVNVADTPPQTQSVTINYLDQSNNNPLASPYVDTNPTIGNNVYGAKTISGYTVVGSGTMTVTVSAGDNLVENFYYTANESSSGGSLPQSVTVNYINQANGNPVTNPTVDNNPVIGNNTYTAKSFSDYTLVGNSTQTVNVQAGQNYTITFYYTLNPVNNWDNYIITCYDEKTGDVIDTLTGIVPLFQYLTVQSPEISGYTLDYPTGFSMYGLTPSGQTFRGSAYYKMNPAPPIIWWTQPPPTTPVHEGNTYQVDAAGFDPQRDNLTYYWTMSDGQVLTNQSSSSSNGITQNGGTLTAGAPGTEVISVYAVDSEGYKSNTLTGNAQIYNNPPVIYLNVPSQAYVGDNIPISATIYDPDIDNYSTVWSIPSSMKGGPIDNVTNISTINNINTTVYFNQVSDANQTYNFSVTATDQWGLSTTATASIKILAVTPTASLALTGTQKENRLDILSANDSAGSANATISSRSYQFYDSANNLLTVDSDKTSSTVVKALNTPSCLLNNQNLQFLIKKAGTYTAKYTVTNSFGFSATATQSIIVSSDLIPLANLYIIAGDKNAQDSRYAPNGTYAAYANPNNTDAQGHALYTRNLYDNNNVNSDGYTADGDTIAHRVWIRCWDSTNSKTYYARDAEVYSGGKWQSLSNFITFDNQAILHDVIPLLDISKIDDGNCTSIVSQVPWVAGWYYYLITQEAYGQPTIPQLITNADYRISDRTDVIK